VNYSSKDIWYLVGLVASDGCLSNDGRHVIIVAKDRVFLQGLKRHFSFSAKVGIVNRNKANESFRLQIGDVKLYRFLLNIGLMANKSLTLGRLKIPKKHFSLFLRGVIDGDGCIRRWNHPQNGNEQWSLRIYSGSKMFLLWLNSMIEKTMFVTGPLHTNSVTNVYVLKYGKMAAKEILRFCYCSGGYYLRRKYLLARACVKTQAHWTKSPTKLCPGGGIGRHKGLREWVSFMET
jgi:hypothetical protein